MNNRTERFVIAFLILSLFFSLPLVAGPQRTTYQARIIKPNGEPLQANSVNFRFTILDPTGSCVLYVEDYAAVNMTGSSGLISFSLGSGIRTYPVSGSASTLSSVFNNSTTSYSCQSPGIYTPTASDNRKIVMQFNDANGWQTLPAMAINAVPYAMYADETSKLNGKSDTDFVQSASIPTCTSGQALFFNGVSFSCVAMGGSGVTSSTITAALGYTPVDGASFTSLVNNFATVSSTVYSVSSTLVGLQNEIASLTTTVSNLGASSPWTVAGSNTYYTAGNVGIGTSSPSARLHVTNNNGGVISQVDGNPAGLNQQVAFHIINKNISAPVSSTLDLAIITAVHDYAVSYATTTGGGPAMLALGENYAGIYGNARESVFDASIGTSGLHISNRSQGDTRFSTNLLERMRIARTTGYVGIGTSAPTSRLDVGGQTQIRNANTQLILRDTDEVAGEFAYIERNVGAMHFGTNNGTSSTVALTAKNGNVGIGMTNPGAKLEVAGQVKITGGTPGLGKVLTSDANGLATWEAAAGSSQWITSGTTLYSNNSANVGVGTTTPELILSRYWNNANDTRASSIFHYFDSSVAKDLIAFGVAGDGGSYSAPNQISQTKMVVRADGFVGIGTTSPRGNLDVSSTNIAEMYLTSNGGANYTGSGLVIQTATNASGGRAMGVFLHDEADQDEWFAGRPFSWGGNNDSYIISRKTGVPSHDRSTSEDGLALFVVKGNGFVGVNNPNPSTNFEVSGTVKITGGAPGAGKVLTSDANGLASWQSLTASTGFTDGGNSFAQAADLGTNDNFDLNFRTNNSTKMTILASGSVGIGNPNPGAMLDVYGMQNTTAPVFRVRANGSNWASLDFGIDTNNNSWLQSLDYGSPFVKHALNLNPTGGNVGIGTATPTAQLEVAGQVKITGGSPGSGKVLASDASGLASWQDPAAWSSWSVSGSNTYRSSGFVGVGTANPTAPMTLDSNNGAGALNPLNDSNTYLTLGPWKNGNGAHEYRLGVDSNTMWFAANTNFRWYKSTDATVTMALNNNYLGVGTGNPQSNFVVANGTNQQGLEIQPNATYARIFSYDRNAGSYLPISFDGNSKVGIGTINPGAQLEVAGQVKITGGSPGAGKVLTSDGSGLASWQTPSTGSAFVDGGNSYSQAADLGTNDNFDLNFRTNNSTKMTVLANGNVGISTTSPQSKLSLGNTANATNRIALYENGANNVRGIGMVNPSVGGYGVGIWADKTPSNDNMDFFVKDGGQVSIGTNYPGMMNSVYYNWVSLHAKKSGSNYVAIDGDATGILLNDNTQTANNHLWSFENRSAKAQISTYDDAGNGTPRFTVDRSGNAVVTGQLKINGGSPGNGKVLTSDGSGLATWQNVTPSFPMNGGTDSFYNQGVDYLTQGGPGATRFSILTGETYNWGGYLKVGGGASYLAPAQIGFFTNTGFTTSAGQGVERLRITDVGNVGIGTSSPGAKLEVAGQVKITGGSPGAGKVLTSDASGLASWQSSSGFVDGGNTLGQAADLGTNDNYDLNFRTNNSTKMTILASGSVGIGTATPGGMLHIGQNDGASAVERATLLLTRYWGSASDTRGAAIFSYSSAGHDKLVFGVSGDGSTNGTPASVSQAKMTIQANGNVGIGTLTPSHKFHLVGDARIQGSVTDCYIGNGSGGTSCSSDARLKENIKPIPYALDKVLSLRGVEFDWNSISRSYGRHDIGVIAQDVEKVFPTAVTTGGDGYKKVDYAVLVAPLIQAIKELYTKFMGYDEKIATQQRQIASLQQANVTKDKEIQALKKYLCNKDPEASICEGY